MPAYGIASSWPEAGCQVRLAAVRPLPEVAVTLRLGGEEQVLGIPALPVFSTVHQLLGAGKVEQELLLAALEADAGGLFDWLEKTCQMQLTVTGLATLDDVRFSRARAFGVYAPDGRERGSFLLSLSPAMLRSFGSLAFLDAEHESWRHHVLPAEVELAHFHLESAELAGLAAGDMLLLPELSPEQASWPVTLQVGDCFQVQGMWQGHELNLSTVPLLKGANEGTELRICLRETVNISLPMLLPLLQPDGAVSLTLTAPEGLKLVDARGELLAEGRLARVGVQQAMALEAMEGH